MNKCDTNVLKKSWSLKLSWSVMRFLVLFALFIPPTAVFSSPGSSIPEVQLLLKLANSSLLRGDLDSSIGSLDEALNMTEDLKADGDGEDNIDNGNSNGLEDAGDRNDDDDSDASGGEIVDDNVERSQRCVENAKPGEVCAFS